MTSLRNQILNLNLRKIDTKLTKIEIIKRNAKTLHSLNHS